MQSVPGGSSGANNASEDLRRLIRREQDIIDAARRLRTSARNKSVRSQCDSQISEAARNISYLQEQLTKLSLEPNSRGSPVGKKSSSKSEDGSSTADRNAKVTRLDLFRWDRPASMGPRIKLMLQQLEYKTSIEQQYERGTRKMIDLYQQTGDRRSQSEARSNLAESVAKMAILKRSTKRYSDMNLAAVLGNDEDDEEDDINGYAVPNMRKPLTGILRVLVAQVEEVDHTIFWTDQVEMWVTMKVENNSAAAARTRTTSTSRFDENFTIPVDKGNEVEFTVYDRSLHQSGDQQSANPVALLWLRISDIAEAIRQKRVERELKEMGWASAAQVQAQQTGRPGSPQKEDWKVNHGTPGSSDASEDKRNTLESNETRSGSADSPNGKRSNTDDDEIDTVEGWFTLEPAGRVYLKLGFEKTGANTRKRARAFEQADLARLGRHNAIRKREETQQVHGHEFVPHQTYNIIRCAVCGDHTGTYFQCQECQLTCDRKCFSKIVTKCTALMSHDPDEELNHRIPHHFEPTTNMKAAWCAQCGFILPLASRKNVRKCTECSIVVHANCTQYVPNLCGMSMETAAQVVNEINSTRIRQATKAAAGSYGYNRHEPGQLVSSAPVVDGGHIHHGQDPHSHHSHTHKYQNNTSNAYGLSKTQHVMPPPPPKTAPVRRKQVPGMVPAVPISSGSESSGPEIPITRLPSTTSSGSKVVQPVSKPQTQLPTSSDSSSVKPDMQQQSYEKLPKTTSVPSIVQVPTTPSPKPPSSAPPLVPAPRTSPDKSIHSSPPYPSAPDSHGHKPPQSSDGQGAAGRQSRLPELSQSVQPLSPPKRRRRKVGLDDFSFLAVLGKGNFGKVMLAESKHTGKLYAIKVLKKNFIIDNREVESTRSEKRVFLIANREQHPFLINLSACFQTENRIYFVMDYVSGGDLMFHIQQKMFSAKRAQFYAAEVLLAIKHFHDNDVIYRDLKLDNILLNLNGHIKVADYGLCKENMGVGQTTGTFCGTPDFIAPEILLDQKYGRSVDWWALGVLMYQMLLGKSPFHGNDEDEVYDAILSDEPLYPIHMPRDSVSILQQLLTRDPSKRLGSGPRGAEEIMKHPYFANINFEDLFNLKIEPPFKPELDSPTDVRYFERDFTSEMPALTPMNSTLTPEMQDEFRGFSYSLGDFI